jgi:hypothetical protein
MIVWNSCRWLGYYLDPACCASAIVPVPAFPCYCAYAIVPVPSCPCHHARAIVPVNDTCFHVGEARKSLLGLVLSGVRFIGTPDTETQLNVTAGSQKRAIANLRKSKDESRFALKLKGNLDFNCKSRSL